MLAWLIGGNMYHIYGPWYRIGRQIWKDIKDKRYLVAEVADWSEDTDTIANIITNAPELFDALKDLVNRCDTEEGVRADGSNIDTLKAHIVLAKIENGEW